MSLHNYDLEGDLADAILLGFEEGGSPWTRRAAARVLALLRDGQWFDGAVERMLEARHSWPEWRQAYSPAEMGAMRTEMARLLRTALGEG